MRWPIEQSSRVALVIGVMAVAVRLIAINQPFVDVWSWRQSDVASIARNYFTNGFHFAYPQVDWTGNQPGYVGTEFPILPFLTAGLYKVFGVCEWIGRSQSVAAFALSLPFFFLLVRDLCGAHAERDSAKAATAPGPCEAVAAWALFFYAVAPLGIMASRCFMPDMPSLALTIIGLDTFVRWMRDDADVRWAVISGACISLAILTKATSAVIGLPLAVLAFERRRFSAVFSPALWMYGAAVLLPSALWYWHAHDVADRFYPHHFFGAGGIHLQSVSWYWDLLWRTATTSLTPLLFLLAIVGVVLTRKVKRFSIFHWWLGAMILFVIVVGYGNRHPWYQLPFVPIAAAFAGYAAAAVSQKLPGVVCGLGALAFIVLSWFYIQPLYRPAAEDLREAGLTLKGMSPPASLAVVADYGDPTLFYYAERKGWHFTERGGIYNGHPDSSADAIADLEGLRGRGATHMIFYSGTFWWLNYYADFAQHLEQTATLTAATPQFKIFALNRAPADNQ